MTSEKQIAANRANAKRSTGPKTAAGKRSSSGNALRHGLSKPLPADPPTIDAIGAIACAVAAGNENAAIEFARSELDLRRIRQVRKDYLTDLAPGLSDGPSLQRFAALDRYERIALAKSRRARRLLAIKRSSSATARIPT
jgi:hypothetical protein